MRKFLDDVAGRFDWVLLDTPPVGSAAGTPKSWVDWHKQPYSSFGAGHTPFAAVERAIADLGRECIIGTVLNDVDPVTLQQRPTMVTTILRTPSTDEKYGQRS
jgi:hypothetical protein